jgi:hypothetical protein
MIGKSTVLAPHQSEAVTYDAKVELFDVPAQPNLSCCQKPGQVSGLKYDAFERLATREAVEIPGHHAPATLGGRVG